MKTKTFFTIISILTNLFVSSQNQDWEVHIGLSNRAEAAEDVLEYYDKGYYVEGLVGLSQQWHGWNVKTNINGQVLWDKILNHNQYILFDQCATLDSEGNRYVTGDKFNNDTWPFVSKFNPCGEKVWCKILADSQLDEGSVWDMIINENDEIILLGNYLTPQNEMQIYLDCLSKNGEYLWKKQYARKEDHPWIDVPVAYDLMEHNKEYYISGYCYWPFPSDTTHFYQRPLFIGIDSLFNEKWILPFYSLDSVFGKAFYSIPINDSIILGAGIRRYDGNIDNSLLAMYNIKGVEVGYSEIFNEQIGTDIHSNHIRDIDRINDTLFIAAALFGTDYNINPGGELVLDTAGNLYNFLSHPNTSSASLIKSSDNNFVLASTITETNGDKNIFVQKIDKNLQSVPFDTNTYTYDSLCPEQIQSGTIDLSDCFVWTGTEEIPSPEEYYSFIATIPITAFPNPAEIEITLVFQNTDHHTSMQLECYNIYGQRVHSEKIWKGQQEARIDLQGWAKGLYFAVVKSEGKVAGSGRYVVK
jgi:hypothetical protein